MRLMNELLRPGIFGNDIQRNLTRLQDIIDDNHLTIFKVMDLVCMYKNNYYADIVCRQNSQINNTIKKNFRYFNKLK